MAALNKTAVHGHGAMNMTDMNMTDIPPPGDFAPATMTAINQTWHGHGHGNRTLPPPLPGSSDTPGQQAPVNQQEAQSQKNAGTSLIDELITWLKAHGVS